MAIVGNIAKAIGIGGRKISCTSTASAAGLAAVVTGLSSVVAGGAFAGVSACPTSVTFTTAEVTGVVGGTVSTAVALLTYAGPTIALGSTQVVSVLAIGS